MPPENTSEFSRRYQTAVLIYFSLVSAVFAYAVLGWFVLQRHVTGLPPLRDYSGLRNGLLVLAVCQISVSLWIRNHLVRGLKNSENTLNSLLVMTVIGGALGDAVGIYGLVLILSTRHFPDIYPFIVLATVIFFFNFPRQEEWKRWMAN